jgi:hypothetical protein
MGRKNREIALFFGSLHPVEKTYLKPSPFTLNHLRLQL